MAMVKFWRGLLTNLPSTRADDSLYFGYSADNKTGKLYLGQKLIAEVNDTDTSAVNSLIAKALEAYYTKNDIDGIIAGLDNTVDNGDADLFKVTIVEEDGILTSVEVDESRLATQLQGKKNIQTAVLDKGLTGAKVLKNLSQNTNGDISYETRDLTPADIGAQPAGNYQPAGSYKTKQGAVADKILDNLHILDSLTQNENGEISYSVRKLTLADLGGQAAGDYKTKQAEVSNPNANGNATAFIDSITQNANGEITVTKKNITAADLGLSGAMHFLGLTDTVITDNATTATVRINSKDVTAKAGDVVLYNNKEFVFDGLKWHELGDGSSHALKTTSITGTGYLTGGGAIDQDRTIDIAQDIKTKIDSIDNKKVKQQAYSEAGSTTKTITNVTQNANGEITVTYGDIAFPAPPTYTTGIEKVSLENAKDNKLKVTVKAKDGSSDNAEVVVAYADEAVHATNADEAGHAGSANSAAEATHALNADNADEAVHATNADEAENAGKLGGQESSYYAVRGNTNVTLEEAVIAINKLSSGAENANSAIGTINSNIDDILEMLTWHDFPTE